MVTETSRGEREWGACASIFPDLSLNPSHSLLCPFPGRTGLAMEIHLRRVARPRERLSQRLGHCTSYNASILSSKSLDYSRNSILQQNSTKYLSALAAWRRLNKALVGLSEVGTVTLP